MQIRRFVFNHMGENTYLASDAKGNAVIVDPGCNSPQEEDRLLAAINEEKLTVRGILVTHGHFDHICGARSLQDRFGAAIYMGENDLPILQYGGEMGAVYGFEAPDTGFSVTPVRDGGILEFGDMRFRVIETPGHSPGGVCYLEENEKELFSGDTLFRGTIGRTDLPLASYDKLIVSIMDKLMGLDGDVRILPGHGGDSTIAQERTGNPFLEPWGEAEDVD
jgi:glyoxylase-like metal-dependent hydrolase (beta-lactamase superfamily II)